MESYFDILEKRLSHGLSITNIGTQLQKERLGFALEVHRLMPLCPLVKEQHVFRIIYLKKKQKQPNKVETKQFMDFYRNLVVVMAENKWPASIMFNFTHEYNRNYVIELNELCQRAFDGGQLRDDEMNKVRIAAQEEVKEIIKNRKKEVKEKSRIIKCEQKTVAKQERKQRCAEQVKKQKNGGHQQAQIDHACRQDMARQLQQKVHKIYIERHGNDVERIDADEYREILSIISRQTTENRNANLREKTADREQLKKEKLTNRVCHKVRLSLNNKQRTYIDKCIGISRFTYNWAVRQWLEAREKGKVVYTSDLSSQFSELSKTEYTFSRKVTHNARNSGFKAFSAAIDKFIERGWFPTIHKRKGIGSFSYVATSDRKQPFLSDFNPDIPDSKPSKKRQYLLIPTFGYVKMMQKLRFNGLLSYVTIKREADGHYYACLYVYVSREEWQNKHRGCNDDRTKIVKPLGIDLGLSAYATLSNGMLIESRDEDAKVMQRQKKLQARIRRCAKAHPKHTSNRQKRLSVQLGRAKAKIRHQREDYLHKLSSALAYTYNNIAIEDLNINAMLKENPDMAFKIRDAAFYRFRKMLEQKMNIIGGNLKVAEKFHPSTRICSVCGNVKEEALPLTQRTYHCKACGVTIDRDLNSAINLARLLGLGDPNYPPADKGPLTTALQASDISVHQAKDENR